MISPDHQWLIDRLKERGFEADFRQWAMGDTIQVLDGPVPYRDGLTVYKHGAYLVPAAQSGLWGVDIGIYDDLPVSREEALERVTCLLRHETEFQNEWTRRRLKLEANERRNPA